jgi:hypothetical protein
MAREGNVVPIGFSAVDKGGAEDQTVEKLGWIPAECRCPML